MLIYVNCFEFEPEDGPKQIISLIAQWLGQKTKSFVDASRLAVGIRDLTLKDGSKLSSKSSSSIDGDVTYPYFFSAKYSHSDGRVSGRRWVTEIGIRQMDFRSTVECSVLLKTEEASAMVNSRVSVTRPRIVVMLVEKCRPVGGTPGLYLKSLNEENAKAFAEETLRTGRRHPIVLISCNDEGIYPVNPEHLRLNLIGLADVVHIPKHVDTFNLQDIVGKRSMTYGGAVKVIFAKREGSQRDTCETLMMLPDEIKSLSQDQGSEPRYIENELLGVITHRTNVPLSWRHISNETVAQAALRTRLNKIMSQPQDAPRSAEVSDYIDLLEEADKELLLKDQLIERIQSELEDEREEGRKLSNDLVVFKSSLSGRQTDEANGELAAALAPLREAFTAIQKNTITLEQALRVVISLYPERVIALDTAFVSARDSDKSGFQFSSKALELMLRMAADYWEVLSSGGSDQQAKAVFGKDAFTATEGQISSEGKRRRTFSYHGKRYYMEKHLKIGMRNSTAMTLRIHLEWIADEKKIIVGYCGKHLDP
jgi:hypothetical protein